MKAIKKQLFFLDIPLYEREIAVVVGMNHKEAVEAAKKQKCKKDFIEDLNCEENVELCNGVADKKSQVMGAAARIGTRLFLFVGAYKDHWEYLDCLNHECFHLVQFMGIQLKMWGDVEPPAYLHSWLFKRLRRTLSGRIKNGA